jgi:hypothetical protein
LAGSSGLSGRIENLRDDDVGVEGAEVAFGNELAAEHCAEVRKRIALAGWEYGSGFSALL